jgi:hypothetical protein
LASSPWALPGGQAEGWLAVRRDDDEDDQFQFAREGENFLHSFYAHFFYSPNFTSLQINAERREEEFKKGGGMNGGIVEPNGDCIRNPNAPSTVHNDSPIPSCSP